MCVFLGHVEKVPTETGNLPWPHGGSTQACTSRDDCCDSEWKMTEQACSQEGGLKYALPCIVCLF